MLYRYKSTNTDANFAQVDATHCDSAAYPKLPIISTVAGQGDTSGPNEGISKEGWSFIMIEKRDNLVQLYIGVEGDSEPKKVAEMTLSEHSPVKASEVTRSATASCQDIGHIVVIARKLSGDRDDGKTVQEKGIVA